MAELADVVLLGIPVAIQAEASEHVDELMREFEHLAATDSEAHATAPGQLLRLRDELDARFAAFGQTQQAQLQEAIARGSDVIDLHYRMPPEVSQACIDLSESLDAADAYCEAGEYLLTLKTPPRALAYRRWFLGQFVDQIAGRPAQSWDDWIAANPEPGPLG